MSKQLLAFTQTLIDDANGRHRSEVLTAEDLHNFALRLDPYTMDAAAAHDIEPEEVTPAMREGAKRLAHTRPYGARDTRPYPTSGPWNLRMVD